MVIARFETERTQTRRKDFSHNRLAEVVCFKGLSVAVMQALTHELDIELFSEGDTIMKETDAASNVIFLCHGSADVICNGRHMAMLAAGSFFGEMACVGLTNRRPCTIVAREFCDCRTISAWQFNVLLQTFPEARLHFENIAQQSQSVVDEAHRLKMIEAQLDRCARRRSAKHIIGHAPGRRLAAAMELQDQELSSKLLLRRRRSIEAEDYQQGACSTAFGLKKEPAPSNECCAVETADSSSTACISEEMLESLSQVQTRTSAEVSNFTTEPVAPSHTLAKLSCRFRRDRWLGKSPECSLESASTTAPSTRSASMDSTNCSSKDMTLPPLSDHGTSQLLKVALRVGNASLRQRLERQRCEMSPRISGLDMGSSGACQLRKRQVQSAR